MKKKRNEIPESRAYRGNPDVWRKVVCDVASVKAILAHSLKSHIDSLSELPKRKSADVGYLSDVLDTAIRPMLLSMADLIHKHAESDIERALYQSLLIVSVADNPIGMVVVEPNSDSAAVVKSRRQWSQAALHMDKLVPGWRGNTYEDEHDQRTHRTLIAHRMFHDALHVMPQAGLPKMAATGKNMRLDALVFVPTRPSVQVVIECDGYKYHSGKDSFSADRQRDRILTHAGYRVLRFSGSEIWNDAANVAAQLHTQLLHIHAAAPTDKKYKEADD